MAGTRLARNSNGSDKERGLRSRGALLRLHNAFSGVWHYPANQDSSTHREFRLRHTAWLVQARCDRSRHGRSVPREGWCPLSASTRVDRTILRAGGPLPTLLLPVLRSAARSPARDLSTIAGTVRSRQGQCKPRAWWGSRRQPITRYRPLNGGSLDRLGVYWVHVPLAARRSGRGGRRVMSPTLADLPRAELRPLLGIATARVSKRFRAARSGGALLTSV